MESRTNDERGAPAGGGDGGELPRRKRHVKTLLLILIKSMCQTDNQTQAI